MGTGTATRQRPTRAERRHQQGIVINPTATKIACAARHIVTYPSGGEIFLHPAATDAQVAALRRALERDHDIASIHFVDHDQAYQVFKASFGDSDPDIVATTKPSDLPVSFQLQLRDPGTERAVEDRYKSRPEVDTVISSSPQLLDCKTP